MKRSGIFLLIVVLTVLLIHPFILGGMANFLMVQDKIEKADLILVLGGDSNGERVSEGVKLFKEGYAPHMLMSGGPLAWKLTYAGWMKKQAVEEGVPAGAILLQEKSRSTIDDARFSLPIVQQNNFRSLILVTSPSHARRAARVFRKVYKPVGVRVYIHPVQKSEFNPDRWWTRHEDTGSVVWEYAASVLYFFKGY